MILYNTNVINCQKGRAKKTELMNGSVYYTECFPIQKTRDTYISTRVDVVENLVSDRWAATTDRSHLSTSKPSPKY